MKHWAVLPSDLLVDRKVYGGAKSKGLVLYSSKVELQAAHHYRDHTVVVAILTRAW
jgi:hypothetical protein